MRQEFIEKLGQVPKEQVIYLDESGFDSSKKKDHGWALRGARLFDIKSGNRRKNQRLTVIAALCNRTELIAPFYFQGYTNTQVFCSWLEQVLVPLLKPGQVIVMDNATFHKNSKVKQLIESARCSVIYLPPYSPDFNPIEHKWAHLKNFIKKSINKHPNFIDLLHLALSKSIPINL